MKIFRRTRKEKVSFLILTKEGLDFVKKWFGRSGKIPPNIAKVYQLLLKLIMMGGTMSYINGRKLGYSKDIIMKAISENFLRLIKRPVKPPDEVSKEIRELIGKAPKRMFT